MRLAPFNLRRLIMGIFIKKKEINATNFLLNWENENIKTDPSLKEIAERLKTLGVSRVLEIGAGYGRVANYLEVEGMTVLQLEPNEKLHQIASCKSNRTVLGGVEDIKNHLNAIQEFRPDIVLTVRIFDYISLWEAIKFLNIIGSNFPIISFESHWGSSRLFIARLFSFAKVSIIESLTD